MRVRFDKTKTITAESDWFVCRCNSGVMQFVASNHLRIQHRPGVVPKAELQPNGVIFDTRLNGPERVPDHHVHCFRDFRTWLHSKPDFAKPTDTSEAHLNPAAIDHQPASVLDSLALSSLADLKTTYDTVKDLWRSQCLREPQPPAHAKQTYPGSTDGSMDVLHMPASVQLDIDPYTNVEELDRGRFWQPTPSTGWTKPLWKR